MFEELEQIPWSEMITKPKRPRPWALALAAVVVGAAIAALRITPSQVSPETLDASAPPAVEVPRVEEESERMLSEADLRASAAAAELVALGGAVVEVRATSSPSHYVEWAVAEGVTPLGNERWAVRVAFQVLIPGPNGPERSEIRRVDVPIEVLEGRWRRIGPFALSTYTNAPVDDVWSVEQIPVTAEIVNAVLPLFAAWGDVHIDSAETADRLTRVTVDTGGMRVAVWLDETNQLSAVPLPRQASS